MIPQLRGACILLAILWSACSLQEVRGALGAANVLVLYNQASPDGIAIANYYAQVHPGVKLLGLANVTTNEDVSASDYLNVIRPQILPALSSSIDVLVTTKGLPLRIGNAATGPSSYTDPFNVNRAISTGYWKQYSSLESELTRIDSIKTLNQMGDNYFTSVTGKPSFPNPSANPYYQSSARTSADFHYANYYNASSVSGNAYGGMRLASRLDGYTVADVEAAIDRARQAVVLPQISQIVLDDDPSPVSVDQMATLKDILAAKNQPCVYDNTANSVTQTSNIVMGYVSHGVHAGLPADYIPSETAFTLGAGAVFETHESYNAYSFQPAGNTMGQGQVAQWLAVGGTVGVGNVQEPGAGISYEANEDKIVKMLLDGKTWAEAAWSSIRQLSYVNTVVGDPLMTWKQILPADVNEDGVVDSADLDIISANWSKTGAAGGAFWTSGDLNADGVVESADFGIFFSNWGKIEPVPEPAVLHLLVVGLFLALPVAMLPRKRLVSPSPNV
jgi:uncharacterized protein (TIGR03790 family)